MVVPKGEVKRVADALLGRILSREYPAGLRLPPEAALAEELACGRSTIREALRHVAGMGLVQSRQGSGATVLDFRREGTPGLIPKYLELGQFDVDPGTMAREMLRLRTLMATEAVRLAASYTQGADLQRARELIEGAAELEDDPVAHAQNELQTYRELVMASGMWPAVWMVNALFTPLEEINNRLAPLMPTVHKGWQRTMRRMLRAIEQQDEAAAMHEVRTWFARVDKALVDQIEVALAATFTAPEPPSSRRPQ